jgi:hypothetical protein
VGRGEEAVHGSSGRLDSDKCKGHALYVIGKALRNVRSMLNKEFVEKGRTPFEVYSFITHDV